MLGLHEVKQFLENLKPLCDKAIFRNLLSSGPDHIRADIIEIIAKFLEGRSFFHVNFEQWVQEKNDL